MLGENIKALRKEKGYSQETLAQQLNVVRQTISKWEKGLSVPDAEQLERIAELFEVPVTELLQSEARPEEAAPTDMAEIVRQLAILNDQLAMQARSRRRTIRVVLIVIAVLIIVPVLAIYVGGAVYTAVQTDYVDTYSEYTCTLDGQEYLFFVRYDDNGLKQYGGDPIVEQAIAEASGFEDVDDLIEYMEGWFAERGGALE